MTEKGKGKSKEEIKHKELRMKNDGLRIANNGYPITNNNDLELRIVK